MLIRILSKSLFYDKVYVKNVIYVYLFSTGLWDDSVIWDDSLFYSSN